MGEWHRYVALLHFYSPHTIDNHLIYSSLRKDSHCVRMPSHLFYLSKNDRGSPSVLLTINGSKRGFIYPKLNQVSAGSIETINASI
jgi:hypothetical protein